MFACMVSCSLRAQQVSELKAVNGTKLFVSVQGKGKESLLVLHGGPGLNHTYFMPHLNEVEKKFSVIYYDQRASGQSHVPSPDSISIEFLVNDLEELRKLLKIKKLNILAHSWGAVLAVHYALAYPGKIKKLILTNPAMLSREYDQEAAKLAKAKTSPEDSVHRAQLMASGEMDVKKYEDFMLLSFKSSAFDPTNLKKLDLNLPANFQEASKALFTGLMKDRAHQVDLYPRLSALKFPVLIITGVADIIPPASIEKLQSNLPFVSMQEFKQSGHFPFIEETTKFNQIVIQFLEQKGKNKSKKASR